MNTVTYLTDRTTAHATACSHIKPMNTMLDIGCGINPFRMIVPETFHHIADPHQPYLDVAVAHRLRDGGVHNVSWQGAIELYPEKSVDTVILSDIIEHLEKAESEELLKQTVKIAKQEVFIFTPYGFMEQPFIEGPDPWGLDNGGNQYQIHKSGWLPEDFDEYNAQIFVCKEYHVFENRRLPLPSGVFGAMWVIISA